jgi:hypothetical protein
MIWAFVLLKHAQPALQIAPKSSPSHLPVLYPGEAPAIDMLKGSEKINILLLVSDPLVRAVTQKTLEQEGFVVVAGDWVAALRLDDSFPRTD